MNYLPSIIAQQIVEKLSSVTIKSEDYKAIYEAELPSPIPTDALFRAGA